MTDAVSAISERKGSCASEPNAHSRTLTFFILAVLGFSFWFFMAVPFASHRETYWWLAMVRNQPFAQAFGVISSTYRPLAQGMTWLAFLILDPHVFPTSVVRQTLLQVLIYGMFVFAWWFIYSAAPQRRLFALVAFVAGGVFFSGYVHLFHIYGIFYVPVILTLGALLKFHASGTFRNHEVSFAMVATVLALWHPFATALFVGFYFGFYLDTFRQRTRVQHVQAITILLVALTTIAALVFLFPRAAMPIDTRLFGFLVSYQTNEVNAVASLVALVLAQTVVFSMELSPRQKLLTFLLVSVLGIVFFLRNLPLLFLWLCAILIKLFRLRRWSLFFLTLTAALFPFGGGIGTPIYALFAIVLAVYATPLGWSQAEKVLSFFKPRYVVATVIALAIVVIMVRAGIDVPIVTRAANPLLMERERTYQLERILAWLHESDYCGDQIVFVQNAGSPINSIDSVITRKNRPPANIQDVRLFWDTVLRCRKTERFKGKTETAIVTFGGPALADASPVFEVEGRYAGDATVWLERFQK
jgi:hypothetical protein